jgi:hypothetical protein
MQGQHPGPSPDEVIASIDGGQLMKALTLVADEAVDAPAAPVVRADGPP